LINNFCKYAAAIAVIYADRGAVKVNVA
jgi:hypothetical protein